MTKIEITDNEIHLWCVEPHKIFLQQDKASLQEQFFQLLTQDEQQKQQRYKFENDRHDALITRAFIRDLLSYYADVAPKDWRFEKGEKDKPEIVNAPLGLRFNISHTKNLIICAVTLSNDIGCDVENTTRNNDVLAIADRFFSVKETKDLFSLPKEKQRDRFFDYWTLKESYIKAWGLGLAIPLKDFSFTIGATESNGNQCWQQKSKISLSFTESRNDTPEHWRSWLFYPSEEHRIAVSIKANSDIQHTDFSFRFFHSVPLVKVEEIFLEHLNIKK